MNYKDWLKGTSSLRIGESQTYGYIIIVTFSNVKNRTQLCYRRRYLESDESIAILDPQNPQRGGRKAFLILISGRKSRKTSFRAFQWGHLREKSPYNFTFATVRLKIKIGGPCRAPNEGRMKLQGFPGVNHLCGAASGP